MLLVLSSHFYVTVHLQDENEKLRQEIQALTIRMKQSSQVQELAAMLQESHKYTFYTLQG